MNNRELDDLLKSTHVPEHDVDYWSDFPRQVLARARERDSSAAKVPVSRLGLRFAWGIGLAAVCILMGFLIGHRQGQEEDHAGNGLLQDPKVIEEVTGLFPNRVRAIIQDEHGLNILLAERAEVPGSAPLWVRVCQGKQCLTLVTFSGQELQIAGQRVTVLSDARGGVILEGDRFAWASSNPELAPADLQIQARVLQLAALK